MRVGHRGGIGPISWGGVLLACGVLALALVVGTYVGWVECGERRGGVTGDMIFCRHVCLGQGVLAFEQGGRIHCMG